MMSPEDELSPQDIEQQRMILTNHLLTSGEIDGSIEAEYLSLGHFRMERSLAPGIDETFIWNIYRTDKAGYWDDPKPEITTPDTSESNLRFYLASLEAARLMDEESEVAAQIIAELAERRERTFYQAKGDLPETSDPFSDEAAWGELGVRPPSSEPSI